MNYHEPLQNSLKRSSCSQETHSYIPNMETYDALCAQARQNPDIFWEQLAEKQLIWEHPFSQVINNTKAPFYRWFEGGTLNASVNCLDKHLGTDIEHKDAIHFENVDGIVSTVTYRELFERVCQLANALRQRGVQTGDRVVLYLPMGVEGVVAMLACARIGAIHTVVFAGFSATSLRERINDASAVAIITSNVQCRSGREMPLKSAVDEALEKLNCPSVKTVLVYERTHSPWPRTEGRDFSYRDIVYKQSIECEAEIVDAEHPLFILYTSGSTGTPKGVVHATAGYLLWAKQTMLWSYNIQADDIFWCTADIGWITGHTYVTYGPLMTGITQVIVEGSPIYPDEQRVWKVIQNHAVTHFYTAPTLIRTLIKAVSQNETYAPENYNLSSLSVLSSVGEPIDKQSWLWFSQRVGKDNCPYIDTFFQTETGGHMIAPLPGVTPLLPGSCTLPLPGIDVDIVDESGASLPWGKGGLLVVRNPWPSMIRTIWNDDKRYCDSYFPDELGGKIYLAGDGAICDEKTGYFHITGRIDDVLNVSGHRLGTMEIESALSSWSDVVAEVAVIGQPDEATGESVCAFVVLKQDLSDLDVLKKIAAELRQRVAHDISPIAKPKIIRFGKALPKTRSGKVMRRLLRALASGERITQDISTLENPAALQSFLLSC